MPPISLCRRETSSSVRLRRASLATCSTCSLVIFMAIPPRMVSYKRNAGDRRFAREISPFIIPREQPEAKALRNRLLRLRESASFPSSPFRAPGREMAMRRKLDGFRPYGAHTPGHRRRRSRIESQGLRPLTNPGEAAPASPSSGRAAFGLAADRRVGTPYE